MIIFYPQITQISADFQADNVDVLIAVERMQEAKDNPDVMRPLSELQASLEVDGLLDSPTSEF